MVAAYSGLRLGVTVPHVARRAVRKLRKARQPTCGPACSTLTQLDATFGEAKVITKLKAVAPAALSRGKTPGKPHDLVKKVKQSLYRPTTHVLRVPGGSSSQIS